MRKIKGGVTIPQSLSKQSILALTCSAVLVSVLGLGSSHASSHREAPYILKYPQVDAADFYAFNSYEPQREGYITLLANYNPTQAAYGGPNYFPLDENALYEIHIDNDGDAVEDITFQFDFSNDTPASGVPEFAIGGASVPSILRNVGAISSGSAAGLSYIESYEVKMQDGRNLTSTSGATRFHKPVDNIGAKTFGSADGYANYARNFIHTVAIPGCDAHGKVFVGQRLDPFKISLGETFDLVNFVPIDAASTVGMAFPTAVQQDSGRNDLARNNVTTIALEIPKSCVIGQGNGVIGTWTTASLPQTTTINPMGTLDNPESVSGPYVQVSRLGNFLVNELFIGFPDKNTFNSSAPKDDAQFATYVTNPVFPAIVDVLFRDAVNDTLGASIPNLAPTNLPRMDLVNGFLTGFPGVNQLKNVTASEMLRLNTGIDATPMNQQNSLGVAAGDLAGFPNGRRPGDDAVDIALRVAMGVLCYPLPIGDGLDLGLCTPADAPIGNVALTDGVPISANDFNGHFPYLVTPYAGSPGDVSGGGSSGGGNSSQGGQCVDTDGDGFGWNGTSTCTPGSTQTGITGQCVDTDGDGFGWNGTATCTP